jgi:uncharacterized protein
MFVSHSPRHADLFLRLDPGADLLGSLIEVVRREQIRAAAISGIGTVRRTTLGYFDAQRREYLKRDFPEVLELVSLSGNLSWVDGEPFVHAHVVVSGPDFIAHAGHLFQAEIAATGELFLACGDTPLERALDARSGLRLIVG